MSQENVTGSQIKKIEMRKGRKDKEFSLKYLICLYFKSKPE